MRLTRFINYYKPDSKLIMHLVTNIRLKMKFGTAGSLRTSSGLGRETQGPGTETVGGRHFAGVRWWGRIVRVWFEKIVWFPVSWQVYSVGWDYSLTSWIRGEIHKRFSVLTDWADPWCGHLTVVVLISTLGHADPDCRFRLSWTSASPHK